VTDLEDPDFEESSELAWGVEVEFSHSSEESVFCSAHKVTVDDTYVQIEHSDGSYSSYPTYLVRKVLLMRATVTSGYTDEDSDEAEIY
jgi:hypothetical protein